MKIYNDVLQQIMSLGKDREGRNGWTRGLFAMQMRFDLQEGFPAVTTKRLAFEQVKAELLWFISGSSDNKELNKIGCHIWDANAEADYWKPKARFDGDLGRIYGVQWRHWQKQGGAYVDQLADVIKRIKETPNDRRHVVIAWNPGELDEMALPPCHMMFQFYVSNGRLSCHMVQRSCDMFLGVPFNIASYALLTHMIAQVCDLNVGELILTLNDAHIYHEHFKAVSEQVWRKPFTLPKLKLNPEIKDIDHFQMGDIKLEDYQHHPSIKAKMIV